MSLKSVLLGAAALTLAPAVSMAAITITVTPSVAPNIFGSPSYSAYVDNAIGAQHDGASSRGNPSLPSYYSAQSNVKANEVIVTNFHSWKGQADPTGAFSNELGNRMLFGIKIDGGGQQFSLSKLSFTATSSDPGNALGFSFTQGSYNYSHDYEGVLAGPDGILWTADDLYITSGPNTQLVDGLLGRGSGNSFAPPTCIACSTAQEQAEIDAVAGAFHHETTFTGSYHLHVGQGVFGQGTFNIQAVPEPATWVSMILGFGMLGAAARRRRAAAAIAA
jgi:hypothetical protein